jgi:hypothetical protein
MVLNFNKLLIIISIFITNFAYGEGRKNKATDSSIITADQATELQEIHEALTRFSQTEDKNNYIYQQKLREMLDSVEARFLACDRDNDNTLDVFETTQCLPQVARQFRKVDIDKDNLITLDEISIMAREFVERTKVSHPNVAKDNKKSTDVISSKRIRDNQDSPL